MDWVICIHVRVHDARSEYLYSFDFVQDMQHHDLIGETNVIMRKHFL